MKSPCLTSKLGSPCSQFRALLLISALPSARPEPRTLSELGGSSPLQTDCLRCSLHCLPLVLCFLPVSSYSGQLKDLNFFLSVPNVLMIPHWEDKAPFIPVFWHFNLFATFPFLSPFPFSLSLSYLACFFAIWPYLLIDLLFYITSQGEQNFFFSILIVFV